LRDHAVTCDHAYQVAGIVTGFANTNIWQFFMQIGGQKRLLASGASLGSGMNH